MEAAQAAGRTKHPSLGAQLRRLLPRTGKKRAAVAVAHSSLISSYPLLTKREPYQDLGTTSLALRERPAVERRVVRRRDAVGYAVSLRPPDSAA